jgi:nucleotide-binding universal stress UspA family protein
MSEGIIAGYDGSLGSDEALRWAVREAAARGMALTICHAWAPEYLALIGDPAVCERARKYGAEVLAHGVRYAASVLDDVRPALAEGSPAQVLCERSGTAEMVVIGTRGHGGLTGAPLGSVSWQVAGHAQGRVVVVRGRWLPVNQSPGPIVVGVDGSPASEAALTFAFEEAALRDVPLVALCALADSPGSLGCARQMEEDFDHTMTIREKEHPGVTVVRHVAVGSPRSALLTAAAEAQLLSVGSRGLGGLAGMRLGSIVQAVLHHSPCPVAVVHPDAPQPWPRARQL